MAVNYNFKKGTDLPSWHWLSPLQPGSSNGGCGNAYDGVRYIYWAVQFGTTATTASTSQLWRYDTWNNGWQFLATLTSGNQGMDVEFDSIRNVVYVTIGVAGTAWQCFNLNTTSVVIAGVTCPAWTITTMTPVLPATCAAGGSIAMLDADPPTQVDSGTAGVGSTTTVLVDANGTFTYGVTGTQLRFTSGALSGVTRLITGWTSAQQVTLSAALGSAPAAGDTYVVEMPSGTATAGSATTLSTGRAMIANQYRNADIVLTGGTGNGQRRRIASNDAAGVLTLAAAVTGNARTGNWATNPDATSTYRIAPSSDFLYYINGSNTATAFKLDIVANPAAAWTALTSAPGAFNGGANLMVPRATAPFMLMALRGNATSNLYYYNIGLDTWFAPTMLLGVETFTTGATAALMTGKRKLFVQKEGQSRCYAIDLTTFTMEPAGLLPYAAPGAYDGHRARFVKSVDGVEWMYLLRSGAQEFYRVALEWL